MIKKQLFPMSDPTRRSKPAKPLGRADRKTALTELDDESESPHGEPPVTVSYLERRKIAILGMSQGAGASFLTLCLARALAQTKKHIPAVVEPNHNDLYDSLGLDKRFSGRDFFPFFATLSQGKSVKGKKNMEEGVNWAVAGPAEYGIRFDLSEKLMLFNQVFGSIVLCDLSTASGSQAENLRETQRLLQDVDNIIAVVDPMPSKMLKSYDLLGMLKNMEEKERNIIYVINKWNGGVYKREMAGFLKVKNPIFMPLLAVEEFYKAEYGCKNPYAMGTIHKKAEPIIKELFHRLNT